jgi:hypothetical protein
MRSLLEPVLIAALVFAALAAVHIIKGGHSVHGQ